MTNPEVKTSGKRKLLAKVIMLAGVVAGTAVGFAVVEWVWPMLSTDRPGTRGFWNEQSWTLWIGIFAGILVWMPFAWISGLLDRKSQGK